MENEKIYVVVPVYKVEAYLERCVESILNQTFDNYELILVDDGSPDNCPAICDQYAEKYDHITVIHQENGGLSAARNAGIEYALKHGDKENSWINFIDSDDFVHPRYLEYLYRAAKEAGVDISSCGFVRTEAMETVDMGGLYNGDCLTSEEYWCRKYTNASVAWGKLYRTFLFSEIRYPVGKLYEDGFTTHNLLFAGKTVAVVWLPLYCWYINPSSITQEVWNPKQMDALYALDVQAKYLRDNGYKEAYKVSLQAMLTHSTKHLMSVYALSPLYNSWIKELKARMKSSFALCVKELGWWRTTTYWLDLRYFRPIKRVLRNESVFTFAARKIKKRFFRR